MQTFLRVRSANNIGLQGKQLFSIDVLFFQNATFSPLVQKIWSSIQSRLPDSIVASYEEGIKRVANGGNVVYVADNPFVDVEQQKVQDKVTFTSDNLARSWQAMAVKRGSPLVRILKDFSIQIHDLGFGDTIAGQLAGPCPSNN
ncbi:hypothetical protein RvY_03758 [Ramazzottius varieornatus]|uniref:Uncharacterized protein n=1 Tax=Ramazzottius varieornatus TaxID=947166 RepID=A0A1D1UUU8_RAMVA|nr:hypothetical protein RvY_03758 [Ramazzottius varieornatus]